MLRSVPMVHMRVQLPSGDSAAATRAIASEGLNEIAEQRNAELRKRGPELLKLRPIPRATPKPRNRPTPHPFTLQPAIHILLLAEEELRGVNRLAES